MVAPLVAGLGAQELIIIALIIVMLFGAKKLPELARGSGRALRIFKAETKGLHDDDDYDEGEPAPDLRDQHRVEDPRELRRPRDIDPMLDADRESRPGYRSDL